MLVNLTGSCLEDKQFYLITRLCYIVLTRSLQILYSFIRDSRFCVESGQRGAVKVFFDKV